MNEVTRIHLGRQQFTMAVDAQHDLKNYLAAIKKKVVDKEVVEEIESRMSELLIERGITDEKVVLPKDIDYLKEQLGTPEDFDDESGSSPSESQTGTSNKRLFRDPDNAIVAGVAAGLANYFGVEPVVVRIAIVLLTIVSFGTVVVLYILAWLILPVANTASEKLQMRGQSVTLEAIKESVNKADVPAKARRLNNSVLSVIDSLFRLVLKLVAIGFEIVGLVILFGVAATRIYMSLHHNQLFQEGLFPVGSREQLLLWTVTGLGVMISVFLILTGIAIFKRKWPLNGWLTGTLAAIFLIGSVTAVALTADAVPRVQQRFQAISHTTAVNNIKPFNNVVTSGDVDVSYISAPNYAVNIHYVDNPDLSKVKIYVTNNTLYIDSRQLDGVNHCTMLCLYPRYDMTVQIYSPNIQSFDTPKHTDIFYPDVPPPPSKQ